MISILFFNINFLDFMIRMWKNTAFIKANGRIPVTLYQSKRSSLKVAIADVPGPMVNGHLSLGFFLCIRACQISIFFFLIF